MFVYYKETLEMNENQATALLRTKQKIGINNFS